VVDLVVAAVASHHGATLLHYDRDFDAIAEITGQPTEWVVPPAASPDATKIIATSEKLPPWPPANPATSEKLPRGHGANPATSEKLPPCYLISQSTAPDVTVSPTAASGR
jgi:hypothetical protein